MPLYLLILLISSGITRYASMSKKTHISRSSTDRLLIVQLSPQFVALNNTWDNCDAPDGSAPLLAAAVFAAFVAPQRQSH